jgi:uncharacterized membrane-anchored protein YjiN (DUF445 family)
MADDLRRRVLFAVSLTVCGLMADLGYVMAEAAARFALDHRWPESAAFLAVGAFATWYAVAAALSRAGRPIRCDHPYTKLVKVNREVLSSPEFGVSIRWARHRCRDCRLTWWQETEIADWVRLI